MKRLILPILVLTILNIKAQNIDTLNQIVISNAGEVLESENYVLNFTLGEFAIETLESDETMLTQGFHQTDPSDSISVVATQAVSFDTEIIVYPNPFQNVINIEMNFLNGRSIEIRLFDGVGKILQNRNHLIRSNTIELDVSEYPNGVYYLEITDNKEHKKQSTKIIKS